ncbi:hypothetical protein HYH54_02815 [Clostridium botulinum]|nr:hypothetical protein [Clostridium botulinum]MBY6997904.1 hypothetical protein [Clostridium botulinum]MBY7010161.1 hypothetical protein [Clostridium botulinum]MCR1154542.1 hypothetical protein [Clostridium botulinum]
MTFICKKLNDMLIATSVKNEWNVDIIMLKTMMVPSICGQQIRIYR